MDVFSFILDMLVVLFRGDFIYYILGIFIIFASSLALCRLARR